MGILNGIEHVHRIHIKMVNLILAYFVAVTHGILIIVNLISVVCLIVLTPFYIWVPMISLMISPFLGGTYCIFNNIENYYRKKAGLPEISDRLDHFLKISLDFLRKYTYY